MTQPREDNFAGLDTPPLDTDIEQAVLGALLANPKYALPLLKGILAPSDFYLDMHRAVYQMALDLQARGILPDAPSVASALKAGGMLDRAGGISYVFALLNSVAGISGLEAHSRTVLEYSRQRALLRACGEARRCISEGQTADETINHLKLALEDILRRGVDGDEIRPVSEIAQRHGEKLIADFDRAQLSGSILTAINGVETGIGWLDDAMGGFCAKDLIIVGAWPFTAKTRFTLHLLAHAAKSVPVGFISLDMSGERLEKYMIPVLANTNGESASFNMLYRPHGWGEFEAARIRDVCAAADPRGNFWLVQNPRGRGVRAIEAYIRNMADKDCRIVAIDQAQNIHGWSKGANNRGEYSEIIDGLKEAARTYDVALVLLHQLKRGEDARSVRFPTFRDLKDTANMEEMSDMVLLLHDHQKALVDAGMGFILQNGVPRKPTSKDKPEAIQRSIEPIRPLWINLAKNRNGAPLSRWQPYDFVRGVKV